MIDQLPAFDYYVGHFAVSSKRAYSLVVRNQRFTSFVRSLGNENKFSFRSRRSKVEFWSLVIKI